MQGNRIKMVRLPTGAAKNVKSQNRRQRQALFVTVIAVKGTKRRSRPTVYSLTENRPAFTYNIKM